jgi:hypothetical protein
LRLQRAAEHKNHAAGTACTELNMSPQAYNPKH